MQGGVGAAAVAVEYQWSDRAAVIPVCPPRCDRTCLTQRLPAGRPRQRVKVGGGGARWEWVTAAGSLENTARPTPPFTTAFCFFKKNQTDGKTNKRRTEHASFTRTTKRNTERSFIYTVLCTDTIPNNFVFFFLKCIYGRSGVFLLRVDASARVQVGGSGRKKKKRGNKSTLPTQLQK